VKSVVLSASLGGFIAGFVWMFITALTDGSKSAIAGGGLGFLVAGFVVSGIVATLVRRSKRAASAAS
jgi:hypothetical protein